MFTVLAKKQDEGDWRFTYHHRPSGQLRVGEPVTQMGNMMVFPEQDTAIVAAQFLSSTDDTMECAVCEIMGTNPDGAPDELIIDGLVVRLASDEDYEQGIMVE